MEPPSPCLRCAGGRRKSASSARQSRSSGRASDVTADPLKQRAERRQRRSRIPRDISPISRYHPIRAGEERLAMSLPPGLCLVTGATGFVGSAVVRALLGADNDVRVLARPNGDRRNLLDLAVKIVEGSLEDAPSLARAVAGCRYLFHAAADYRLWVPDPAPMFRANVEGTRVLMRAALDAGIERVVYTSSVATLGLVPEGTADEETPSNVEDMVGPYKRSKFPAEEVVRDLAARRGLPAVIVNPSTPVGPWDRKPTPTGRLILEAARGKMPGYVDTGLNIVHVDDVAAGHLAAAEMGCVGERYILGGENLSLATILDEVARSVFNETPPTQISSLSLHDALPRPAIPRPRPGSRSCSR